LTGFHKGHQHLIHETKRLYPGSELHIAVNTDEYIRAHKHREPMKPLSHRLRTLYEHPLVDFVGVQMEGTPLTLIQRLKPDVIVAGDDYQIENVVGHDLAKVEIIKRLPDISSTELSLAMFKSDVL
jgi:cytidyltransferase-like protein